MKLARKKVSLKPIGAEIKKAQKGLGNMRRRATPAQRLLIDIKIKKLQVLYDETLPMCREWTIV